MNRIMARGSGLTVWQAVIISLTNLTEDLKRITSEEGCELRMNPSHKTAPKAQGSQDSAGTKQHGKSNRNSGRSSISKIHRLYSAL